MMRANSISQDYLHDRTISLGIRIVLAFVLLASVGVRLYRVDEAPRDFWTVRQYITPLHTRIIYYDIKPDVQDWQKELGRTGLIHTFIGEPRIVEHLAARMQLLLGREAIWPMRIQNIFFWVMAGFFLFLFARRLLPDYAALMASALYLFLPYGITASRSLLPDNIMMMGLMATFWLLMRYAAKPTRQRWLVVAAIAGISIWFKPGMSALAILGGYFFIEVWRQGFVRAMLSPRLYLFAVFAAMPAAMHLYLHYLVSHEIGSTYNLENPGRKTNLLLLVAPHFWRGWVGNYLRIYGAVAGFTGVMCCMWFVLRHPLRNVIIGYAIGYAAIIMYRTEMSPSHDYFHFQSIPLLCIGMAYAFDQLRLRYAGYKQFRVFAVTGALIISGIAAADIYRNHYYLSAADMARQNQYYDICAEIGEKVGHNTNSIILDYDMATPFRYLAKVEGPWWPEMKMLERSALFGREMGMTSSEMDAQARYDRFFKHWNADYFIICRLVAEIDRQRGFREFLNQYSVHAEGDRYVVYDLRKRSE
jgi:hypothetical protein